MNKLYSKALYSMLLSLSASIFYLPILISTNKSYNYYAFVVMNFKTGVYKSKAVTNYF